MSCYLLLIQSIFFTLWWKSNYHCNCVSLLMWRSEEKQKQCKIKNMPFGSPFTFLPSGNHTFLQSITLGWWWDQVSLSCLLSLQSPKTHSAQANIFLENPIFFSFLFVTSIRKILRRKQWSQSDTQQVINIWNKTIKECIWIINSNCSLIFRMCEVEALGYFLCIFHFTSSALPCLSWILTKRMD